MNIKKKLALVAIGLVGLSTGSLFIADSLTSNYHCNDVIWLSKSEWKNGAYPAMAPDIYLPPKQACLSEVGNIQMISFGVGWALPWGFFAAVLGMWRDGIRYDKYDSSPNIEQLCKIHLQEKTIDNLWSQKFQIEYVNNLGKCNLCSNNAIAKFIKIITNEQQYQKKDVQ